MGRILSIDYGRKRTGIAVTDPLQLIANGLDTVATADLRQWLVKYLTEEVVTHVVLGYPCHADGNPTALVPDIEKLAAGIQKQFPAITVSYEDESYTSQDAKNILINSGVRKKKRRDKGLIDKISAVLILQNYLESKR